MNTGASRNTDPETSHAAAASVDASALEQMVLAVIQQYPAGCIADDVEDAMSGVRLVSISPRFRPLMKKGLITDTGEKRMGRSGRNQRVMKAVDTARAAA